MAELGGFRHNRASAAASCGPTEWTPRMNPCLLIAAAVAALLSACATAPRESAPPTPLAAPTPITVVEAYLSAEAPAGGLP